MNMRILHSGSQAGEEGDFKNNGLHDPYVHVVFWAPSLGYRRYHLATCLETRGKPKLSVAIQAITSRL